MGFCPVGIKMNTCIIGGNGFIGLHLICELKRTKRKLTIVSRSDINITGVEHIQVSNLFDPILEKFIVEKADEIIFLAYATKPKTSFDDPIKDLETNLPETVHIFELAAKVKRLKKVLYVSSGGAIYGNTDQLFIDENHITKPISPYGITKMAIEHYAHLFFTIHHLPITIVRPSNAYGPGQMAKGGQGFIAYAMQAILKQEAVEIFGEHGTVRDYIYIEDLARALHACLENGKPGSTYNAGTQMGFSNIDIINILRGIAAEDEYTIYSTHKPVRPFDVNRNVLNINKIKSDTEWRPQVNIQEGLKITWQWFCEIQKHSTDREKKYVEN